jgi:hypothetical protein
MLDGMQQRLGPCMGFMTARAVGLRHIETIVFRLQDLCIVTLPAQLGRRLSEQLPVISAVRIVACAALSLGNRFMKGFPRQKLLKLRVASNAKVFLRFIKKTLVFGRVRRMTGLA